MKYRCFHCKELFHTDSQAANHFGKHQDAKPLCVVTRSEIDNLEWRLRRYQDEDTDLHRKIASLESEHAIAVRRAEESGYEKGLQDGKKYYRGGRVEPFSDPRNCTCPASYDHTNTGHLPDCPCR